MNKTTQTDGVQHMKLCCNTFITRSMILNVFENVIVFICYIKVFVILFTSGLSLILGILSDVN